ncbi:Peptidyl-Lys metalloendopeptidase [Grifola frondosa]|uniref:Peptidyl-Lys metalloendopeptidase n=1 Tax=Grifola frondosa TaxID=5627 RepID=A0A1C7MNS7_GRIFR|nr:Peptidyl-Lys metalloendopeptidase [Grifola frondosa]
MFPFSALIVSVPSVVVASAAPGLPVQVTGPIAIHIVQNLKAVHHRRQYRQRNSQIVERSGQPHTDIPNITNRYGDNPEFIGVRFFTALASGESLGVQEDLSEAHNLTSTGSGEYNVGVKEDICVLFRRVLCLGL